MSVRRSWSKQHCTTSVALELHLPHPAVSQRCLLCSGSHAFGIRLGTQSILVQSLCTWPEVGFCFLVYVGFAMSIALKHAWRIGGWGGECFVSPHTHNLLITRRVVLSVHMRFRKRLCAILEDDAYQPKLSTHTKTRYIYIYIYIHTYIYIYCYNKHP